MGVLPLTFPEGVTRKTLGLDGSERITLSGLADISPRMNVVMTIERADGTTATADLLCRIDTIDEVAYYRHGGILPYVLRGMMDAG